LSRDKYTAGKPLQVLKPSNTIKRNQYGGKNGRKGGPGKNRKRIFLGVIRSGKRGTKHQAAGRGVWRGGGGEHTLTHRGGRGVNPAVGGVGIRAHFFPARVGLRNKSMRGSEG